MSAPASQPIAPICRHFGTCGGCTAQDVPPHIHAADKQAQIARALARHGFADPVINAVIGVPPKTRRRATLKAAKQDGVMLIGFHEARTHNIADMHECHVLTPQIFALVGALRERLGALLRDGDGCEISVTQADNGFDVALDWPRKITPALTTEFAKMSAKLNIARLTARGEPVVTMRQPNVKLGPAQIALPLAAFLQPTREGEAMLQELVCAAAGKSKSIIDLFSGCGTFALVLAARARVHAVEQSAAMLEALALGVRNTQGLKPVTTEKRDLAKVPVSLPELKRFDCAVLDPPRAGAAPQCAILASSALKRLIYASCSPESFARDARILCDGGFNLGAITPVDQFLWSSHTELVAVFTKRRMPS